MRLIDWLKRFHLDKLKINTGLLNADFTLNDADQKAAWELYIELVTRIATQPLENKDGDEKTALNSIYSLFPITREILKSNGRQCLQCSRIAVLILNQIVRPFTAHWHGRLVNHELDSGKDNENNLKEFRHSLIELQADLINYTGMLGEMAGVEKDNNLLDIDRNQT